MCNTVTTAGKKSTKLDDERTVIVEKEQSIGETFEFVVVVVEQLV